MPQANDSERRRHPRIILKAFGFKTTCRYQCGSSLTEALLIDISPGGARLRALPTAIPPEKGTPLVLDALLPRASQPLDQLRSKVCWCKGDEFGIAFTPELPLGVGELQTLLTSRD